MFALSILLNVLIEAGKAGIYSTVCMTLTQHRLLVRGSYLRILSSVPNVAEKSNMHSLYTMWHKRSGVVHVTPDICSRQSCARTLDEYQ